MKTPGETPDRPRMDVAQETTQSPGQSQGTSPGTGETLEDRRRRRESVGSRRFLLSQGRGVLVVEEIRGDLVADGGEVLGALNEVEALKVGLRAGDVLHLLPVETEVDP